MIAYVKQLTWPQRVLWLTCAASLMMHLLTAVRSQGWLHPDEHFQVLEFLSYKLGNTPANELAWEFATQSRNFLQVALYYLQVRGMQLLGFSLDNGADIALAVRLSSAMFGWLSLVVLFREVFRLWPSDWTKCLAAMVLLLSPVEMLLHARTSAESMATSFFLCGAVAYFAAARQTTDHDPRRRWLYVLAGLLLTCSFFAKYQTLIFIGSLVLWLMLLSRPEKRAWGPIGFGVMLGMLIGFGSEFWGYGHATFAPWNYFDYQILRGAAAKTANKNTWTFYFVDLWQTWGWMYTTVAGALLCTALWRLPRHWLLWTSAPYFLLHLYLTHNNNLRYLLPAHAMFIAYCILNFDLLRRWRPRALYAALAILLPGYALGLYKVATTYELPSFTAAQYVDKHLRGEARVLVIGQNPYRGNLVSRFVNFSGIRAVAVPNWKLPNLTGQEVLVMRSLPRPPRADASTAWMGDADCSPIKVFENEHVVDPDFAAAWLPALSRRSGYYTEILRCRGRQPL